MRAVGNNFNSATNIFRIFNYALTFLIRPKQLQKIENGIKREREGILHGAHLTAQMPTTVRPSPPGAPPVAFLLVPVGRGGTPRRRRARHATTLPGCLLLSLGVSRSSTPPPGTPSTAPLPPFSLPLTPLLFSPHGQSRHGHSAEKHRGQPLPRSLSAFPRSVSSPASSSPSQASPDALQCRRHHLLLPRAPKAVIVDSSPSSLPRAR